MAGLTTKATIPNPLYVLLEGGQYIQINNALSRSQTDVENYDGSLYRKVVDASMLGNPHKIVTAQEKSKAIETIAVFYYPGAPAPPAPSGSSASVSSGLSYSTSFKAPILQGAETSSAPVVNTDSAFKVGANDVVPEPTIKKRSMLQWWSEAAAAGSLVGWCWLDEFRGWSGDKPQNMN